MSDQKVTVTDVDIPFGRMVVISLKWMLASIPAAILLYIITTAVLLLFGGVFAGLFAIFNR